MPKNSSRSKKPLVSFIIRTKNEEQLIGKVLESLYQQNCENIEVIVIDSGSTDKTLEIVKTYPAKLIKIKPEEYNPSYALNLGILKTEGRYIAIVSGHSVPVSNSWLANGLKNFKKPQVAGISGNYVESSIGYHSKTLGNVFLKFVRGRRKNFNPWLTNTNSIIRRKCWQEYPFDEKLSGCEDYD